MSVVYVCECKHQQGYHAGGRYACRTCDCKSYAPDFQRTARIAAPVYGDPQTLAADGESTSARLRRVEQERDELAASLSSARDRVAQLERLAATALMRETADVVAELASARTELEQVRRARSSAYAANRDLLDELDRGGYSGWIVARDGGRTCTACDREIRRGEAYTTDTTRDAQRHVHCREGES